MHDQPAIPALETALLLMGACAVSACVSIAGLFFLIACFGF